MLPLLEAMSPPCTLFACISIACAAAFAQSAHVKLPEALAGWAEETERLSGGKIALARIYTDPLRNALVLPEDAPYPELLSQYFSDPSFRAQFAAAHALSVNHSGPEGRIHFILLNMSLSEQWTGAEDEVLAHELGHAWLNARGYRAPSFEPGPRACIATITGDLAQHVLIRAEVARRGLGYRNYSNRQIDAELPEPAAAPCRRLILLVHLVDARLGLERERWAALEDRLRRTNPLVPACADQIEAYLRQSDLTSTSGFEAALKTIRPLVERLYDGVPPTREEDTARAVRPLERATAPSPLRRAA